MYESSNQNLHRQENLVKSRCGAHVGVLGFDPQHPKFNQYKFNHTVQKSLISLYIHHEVPKSIYKVIRNVYFLGQRDSTEVKAACLACN